MLVRRSPFAEWVVVYFDPAKIDESKLLRLIRNGGCRNANLVRSKGNNLAMNSYIAGGDMIQLQIHLEKPQKISIPKLPKAWVISQDLTQPLPEGPHFLNIRVPKSTSKGVYKYQVLAEKQKILDVESHVVSLIQ